jgi:hypothetical protein
MNVRHSFLFSYQQFIEESARVINQIDAQDYGPFIDRTRTAIRKIQGNWYFEELGDGVLPHEEDILEITASDRNLGFWFRIILAEFLSPVLSVSSNWSVVYDVLIELGWEKEDCDLLVKGKPPYRLLKPEEERSDHRPLTNESPYWMWLHPHWAKAGWLSINEIKRLFRMFEDSFDEITKFDLKLLSTIITKEPLVLKEYKTYLEEGVTETSNVLSTAIKADRGLTVYA